MRVGVLLFLYRNWKFYKMTNAVKKDNKTAVPWWRISFGEPEVQKLRDSVLSEHISAGPVTEEFEKQLADQLDVAYAVATTSGSVALLMALMALDIQENDEIIMPNRTWIATAHAALMLKAKPVLIDVVKDVPLMDVSAIEEKITSKTKAILLVHLNGRSVDMKAIEIIKKKYNIPVIEDACQAIFSKNPQGFLGTQSEIGCFSLGTTKLISSGQGGVVVTQNKGIYEKLKAIRNHGVKDNFTDHWSSLGFNFKYTDLQASFALVQLTRVDGRIKRLKDIYREYKEGLKGHPLLRLVPTKLEEGELPLYAEILCLDRRRLTTYLELNGVQVRPLPPSLDISDYIQKKDEFPNSKLFANNGMYLPCGPDQPLENVKRVIDLLKDFRS